MTRFKSLLFCAGILLGLLLPHGSAQPIIFHCTQTANPGDVIGLQGDSFGNSPQVWMLHVTGTESSLTPKTQLTVLSGTGSLNTTGSNSYVSALIPNIETPGLYAIWVSADGGATFSPNVYINQAMPWNANDLCGSAVDPNRQFHIYGRNLQFPGLSAPAVTFVSGTISLPAIVSSGTDPYILTVTAPPAIKGGSNYTLMVNNGLTSGTFGIVPGPVLTGTITNGSDPFGIGVPWGADFASFPSHVYTVPFVSSTIDMTVAIQTAINAVSGSGGGVVALQSGTYQLSPGTVNNAYSFLTMKSNVVIQGAGMNRTLLLMTGTSTSDPIGYHFGLYDAGATLMDCGLADLTLHNTATGGSSNLSFPHSNHDRFFAVRTQFYSDVGNNVLYSGSQVVMNNCVIVSGTGARVLSGTTMINDIGSSLTFYGAVNAVFNNNLVQYYNGRTSPACNGASGVLVQGNTISRIAFSSTLGETGGLDVQASQDVVVLGNLLQRDPVLSGTLNLVQNNDGETILNQTGHNNYPCHGNVSSATSTTLTDITQNWTNDYSAPDDDQLYYATIISGPGTGQIRRVVSNGSNTVTVDSPWQVIPGNGSVYSLNHIESLRHLVKDNTLNVGVQGIVYYSISIKDTAIVNNSLNDNGGIWLRSDYRPPPTNRFQVQMDSIVAGNSVTRTLGNPYNWSDSYAFVVDWLVMTGTDHGPGTNAYCMEFRDNTVTAPVPSQKNGLLGEGFAIIPIVNGGYPISDGTTVTAIGTIFQGNLAVSCTNAFHLCTGDYYTMLWDNVVIGAGSSLLYDGTGSGVSHASIASNFSGNLLPGAPSITTQPLDQAVTFGQSATFLVTATAVGIAPTYQWQKNGIDIPGANSTSYTTPAIVGSDNGAIYTVVVTNIVGSLASDPATLTVNAPAGYVTVTSQPSNMTAFPGQTVSFAVSASSASLLTYQWYKNGLPIPGATSSSYAAPPSGPGDDRATFSVQVISDEGVVSSNMVVLSVPTPPIVEADFNGTGVGTGGTGDMVAIGGSGALGTSSQSTYTIKSTSSMGQGNYLNHATAAAANKNPQTIATFTPASSVNSWAALAGTVTSGGTTYTALNGAFDLFVRPVTTAGNAQNWFRPVDFNARVGNNGLRIIFNGAGTNLQFQVISNSAQAFGADGLTWSGSTELASVPFVFASGTVNHVGFTLNTDPGTGLVTANVYGVKNGGAINTGSTANPLATKTFYANAAIIGSIPFGSGTGSAAQWSMAAQTSVNWVATSVDYDTLRLYDSNPGNFPANGAASPAGTAPLIAGPPRNTTVFAGQPATFTAAATGVPAPGYQWRKNGVSITSATAASYTTPGTVLGDNGAQFSVVATNAVGAVASGTATLTVNPSYASWESTHFTAGQLSDPTASGLTANPSGDGMINLMKYALNLDPNLPNSATGTSARKVIVGGTNYLYFTHRENPLASDVTFGYEESTNMVRWNPAVPELVSTGTLDAFTNSVILRIPVDVQRQFLRLKISAP